MDASLHQSSNKWFMAHDGTDKIHKTIHV